MKKLLITVYITIIITTNIVAKIFSENNLKLYTFKLSQVKILDGIFLKAQQTDLHYILALDPDRLLAPYLKDAGLQPKKENYGNWESMGLDGHIGGHYLSALSMMYAATGNKEVINRLNYMIDQLAICQEKNGNGYVGGVPDSKQLWEDLAKGKIIAQPFSLNNKWVPLYNLHKLMAGLRDAYLIAGNDKAKTILINLTNWFINWSKNLNEDQIQEILKCEHGGINEVFADVYSFTGDIKYLELAKRFSHRFLLNSLIEEKNILTGLHANTQIPKVIGFKRIGELSNNKEWEKAAEYFWKLVFEKWTISIGGNSVREHFHSPDDFTPMIESNQGPETCNSYNMLRLTQKLYLSNPCPEYIKYYERTLFNHILSSEHIEKGGFVYFTPMRPRHYRVYSSTQKDFWCCVGTGLENHAKYGEMIYLHDNKNIYINLFIHSKLNWEEKGISLTQKTYFPYEENSEIIINLKKPTTLSIFIRYPEWVKPNKFQITINNHPIEIKNQAGQYIEINRKWENNDKIKINLPMSISIEYLPDKSPWASILYGPIVLGAKTDTTDLDGLWANGGRMEHIANGKLYPIEESPIIISESRNFENYVKPVENKKLTFTISNIIYPEKYKNIELIPFFSIHEARYMIYFPVMTKKELQEKLEAIREKEKQKLALEAITIDQVAPGEQQSELDHNFKGEQTESGIHNGRHWRHAYKWFSYDLKDIYKSAKKLKITYYGLDRDRKFDIFINDNLIASEELIGNKGNTFFDIDYIIPDIIIKNMKDNILTVKFIAKEGSIAGGIYYIRLLKE